MRFSVSSAQRGDYAVVAPVGELDVATTPELRKQLRCALVSRATPALDLREVTFMDTSAVRTLLWADRESRARGRRLQVVASASPLPVLQVCDDGRCFSWMSPEQFRSA